MRLSPGFFLRSQGWLDVDGRHVWLAHDCATERITTMLPWPVWHSTGLAIEPSVSCDGCGLHTFVPLGTPDEQYRCIATFDFDGRRCERMVDHPLLHEAGNVWWGTYSAVVR